MPRVDLTLLEKRISRRATFLTDRAGELLGSGVFDPADVELRPSSPRLVAEAYFLLTEAFKAKRLRAGAVIQEPKIAAFMGMAIMSLWPFQAKNPHNVKRLETVVANPMYAAYCASSIINNDLTALTVDMKRRLYNFLFTVRLPCLDSFIHSIGPTGKHPKTSVYDIDLSDAELGMLDSLILNYELLYRPPSP